MTATQQKAALPRQGQAAMYNTLKPYCSDSIPKTQGILGGLSRRIWVAAYTRESSRQRHAELGHLWSEAACCLGLIVLRILEVRL